MHEKRQNRHNSKPEFISIRTNPGVYLSEEAVHQAQDVRTAADIFSKYGNFIRGVIRYKVGDEDCVDDLFQSFFLSLVYRPPLGNVKNIKGYLYRAIMNDIIDNKRQKERHQSLMRGYAERLNGFESENEPQKAIVEIEEMSKMFKCIETQLDRNETQAMFLRYKNNYKVKEIAAVMGVNNLAAWRFVTNGVKKIKKLLNKEQLQ